MRVFKIITLLHFIHTMKYKVKIPKIFKPNILSDMDICLVGITEVSIFANHYEKFSPPLSGFSPIHSPSSKNMYWKLEGDDCTRRKLFPFQMEMTHSRCKMAVKERVPDNGGNYLLSLFLTDTIYFLRDYHFFIFIYCQILHKIIK